MKDITIAAPFVVQTLDGAAALGYDTKRILKECGISPALLEGERSRIALDRFVALMRSLMVLLNDEAMGLMHQPQRRGSFSLLARGSLHCGTFGDVLPQFSRDANLLTSSLEHSLSQNGNTVLLQMHRRPGHTLRNNYIIESTLVIFHRFFCWLCRARIQIVQVHLDYPLPEWATEFRDLYYGAPVLGDQSTIGLAFDLKDLSLPVRQDAQSLERYIAQSPRAVFTPDQDLTLSQQVRREVLAHIHAGNGIPSVEWVAAQLNLHKQTLGRRLRREHTDYTEIRTQVRRDVAINLLSDSQQSIEAIADTIGFSESSAFVRAFKGWMGMTPLAYRKS